MIDVRLKRRVQPITSPIANLLLIIISMLCALILCAIPISLVGENPLRAYASMVIGAFGSLESITAIIRRATPLLLTGLGTTVAFRSGQWNIGGEGQLYLGALGATLVGLYLKGLPPWLHVALALISAVLFGGIWAAIAGILKAKKGINEIIVTLMLSYIAALMIQYLTKGPLQGATAYMPQTDRIAISARLPLIIPFYRVHAGTILALILSIVVDFLLWRTPTGYEIRAAGFSFTAARYGGIQVTRNIVLAMAISGGLSGLGGASEVLGYHYRLFYGLSPGYGWTGIIVALLGRLNPFGVIASSFLFSSLIVGANSMQLVVKIPAAIASIIQGVIVLFVLGMEILLEYRIVFNYSFQGDESNA